jgi:Ca2+-binding RTX toxin-like protein
MKRKMMLSLCGLMVLGLTSIPLQADFIQCPTTTGVCPGTNNADVINGTPSFNNITGLDGDDSIFAGDNPTPTNNGAVMDKESVGGLMFGVNYLDTQNFADIISGGPGNDFISGGPGHDYIYGDAGNDLLLPNTDTLHYGQIVYGGPGNDTIIVSAGDVTSCLIIFGGPGSDSVNFLGYGPFSVSQAFGIVPVGWTPGFIHLQDPIGGGDVFIEVFENGGEGVETINGLFSPDVTFFPGLPMLRDKCMLPAL